jgi:putative ABC transport system permease protein
MLPSSLIALSSWIKSTAYGIPSPSREETDMSLLAIAYRNIRQRGLASILTMLSMALGVAMVVLVLSIGWLVTESFDRNSNVGYNLIVGSKGGSLQLALNSVFYLSSPIETIPYEVYLELIPGQDGRRQEIERIGGRVAEPERPGAFSRLTTGEGFAIPICMGDYFGRFRVVATTPDFFDRMHHGLSGEKEYAFSSGRNFLDYSPDHGYFEAVIGSQVARTLNKKVGDTFQPTHGDPDGQGHGEGFTIVGILEPTGTPNDRATFVNIEGFYQIDKHAREADDKTNPDANKVQVEKKVGLDQPPRLPLHKRDLSAVLVRTSQGIFAINIKYEFNKMPNTQAVSPIEEIGKLLQVFVTPFRNVLLILTVLVCVVSAISILVSIYNSMNERKRDIAVMRALGARRDVILYIVLLESLMISLGGGVLGWTIGHVVGVLGSGYIEDNTGLQVGMFNTISWAEMTIIPGLVVLAVMAGIIPAMAAYRTDVSKNLAS